MNKKSILGFVVVAGTISYQMVVVRHHDAQPHGHTEQRIPEGTMFSSFDSIMVSGYSGEFRNSNAI
jgi:hypothetical protein